ncbi:hypothetical protein PFISCL1PPCAC_23968, partial [Pristionchus fissidentatus]
GSQLEFESICFGLCNFCCADVTEMLAVLEFAVEREEHVERFDTRFIHRNIDSVEDEIDKSLEGNVQFSSWQLYILEHSLHSIWPFLHQFLYIGHSTRV